ncbi:hypothetical protein V8E51_009483 [Hyaloscypha variabilis]
MSQPSQATSSARKISDERLEPHWDRRRKKSTPSHLTPQHPSTPPKSLNTPALSANLKITQHPSILKLQYQTTPVNKAPNHNHTFLPNRTKLEPSLYGWDSRQGELIATYLRDTPLKPFFPAAPKCSGKACHRQALFSIPQYQIQYLFRAGRLPRLPRHGREADPLLGQMPSQISHLHIITIVIIIICVLLVLGRLAPSPAYPNEMMRTWKKG